MNKLQVVMLGSVLAMGVSGPAQAFDFKKLTDSANEAVDSASQQANDSMDQASQAMDSSVAVSGEAQVLVDSLSTDLGVTQQQAAGGAGALLAMAQNNLSADQFSGILSQVPGLDSLLGGGEGGGLAGSMLGNISSLEGVTKVFSSLGLSPDMIAQFAPKILGFLGGEGVAGTVLDSLSGLWGVSAPAE
ncbi:DUF2780 domain-containing protein [Alcanivorax sp. S6407]|uniref:DUF2780 domain-containing protein n=1 Tax=Alcanivorax sp. S6407 TaxID=2926424 RepID=UPI001FF49968|nr:DUF2780 domain-containing protein [Alcanivorax sp. S6407]MCK0154092.1 DUF2780 domain-containing protein [Alcanivorax sp. S6407]